MASATAERPLVLFLDALDQLSEAHGARRLVWLPRRLPEAVRVVVSTRREADTFAAVTRLQAEEVELGPMSRQEGEELLGLWLDDAGRRLTAEQRANVLDAFGGERSGGRPLYLKLAFEQARLWPSYVPAEDLELGIDGVIQKNLFHRLAREENHGEEFVARTVGYLAASRYGLAEDELLDVLSRDADLYASFLRGSYHLPSDLVARAIEYRRSRGVIEGEGEKDEARLAESWLRALITDPAGAAELRSFLDEVLPRRDGPRLPVVLWSRLFFDLAPYLTERMGEGTSLLAFYHRELGEVGARVYAHAERGQVVHGRLADYFRFRADAENDRSWTGRDVRGLSELPYHLHRGDSLAGAAGHPDRLPLPRAQGGRGRRRGTGRRWQGRNRVHGCVSSPAGLRPRAAEDPGRRRSSRLTPAAHCDGGGLGWRPGHPLPLVQCQSSRHDGEEKRLARSADRLPQ